MTRSMLANALAMLPTTGTRAFEIRAAATVLVLLCALAASRGLQRWFATAHATRAGDARRSALVASRNLLYVVVTLVLASLWLVQLRHFALSIAALATGFMLAGRELVLGLLGRMLHATKRPFAVGDLVEVGTISGQVIDIGLFTTTLLETDTAHQYTGHTIEFPNAQLVTGTVRNLSHTGRFVIESLRVPVGLDRDLRAECDRLLAAMQRACAPYIDEAVRWLAQFEADEVLQLPDFKPRVLVEPNDAFQVDLVARFPVPAARRAYVAQAVLHDYFLDAPRRALEDERDAPRRRFPADARVAAL